MLAGENDQVKQNRTLLKRILITDKAAPFEYREAYKSLRTNVKFIAAAEKAKSFMITSALQEESKSSVSSNLAITLAEEGKKVILVDCDFRKPSLDRYFHLSGERYGITDVLTDTCALSKAIIYQEEFGIFILPVGTIPPNPSELMSTPQMKYILDELKSSYDYVIMDTPPVSVVTDAAIVGGLADGAILVVRSDYAPVQTVQLARKRLEAVNIKIFGIVLTRFHTRKVGKRSGYYYSYSEEYYRHDKM